MTNGNDKPEWAQSRREKENARRAAEGLKPRRRIIPWIILGLIVVGAVAFFVTRPPEPEVAASVDEGSNARQLLEAETEVVQPRTLSQTVKVTGTLVPGQQSDVASQASGRVLSVAVRPGDTVSEGDVLLEIDRATLELQLSQQRATADATRAQLVSSRQQLERTEELARQGLASPSALEQARSATAALDANLAALESAVQSAELALSNASVISPLSGSVASRSVEPGQTVNAGTPLLTIVNLDEMEFQASASVNSSALVAPGQAVSVQVSGLENDTFTGSVTRVNPVAVSGTRTVPIYIELDNAEGRLRGGMFATGHITVAEKPDAIAIPASAIREDAEGEFVLVLSGETLERHPIEPGREWDRGRIVEVSGVEPGLHIVSAALPELTVGDHYELIED